MASDFVEISLTCEGQREADEIAQALLEQRLVACVKFLPITSRFRWHGKISESQEVLLLMESVMDNFTKIEVEVARLHSYETFVLKRAPITAISQKAKQWLKDETVANN